jgi:hypothetical protein
VNNGGVGAENGGADDAEVSGGLGDQKGLKIRPTTRETMVGFLKVASSV